MSFTLYKEVFQPTSVARVVSGSFTGADEKVPLTEPNPKELILLKGGNLLELYQVLCIKKQNFSGKATTQYKLNLLRSVQLGGELREIATLPGRSRSQRDALVVLSETAQVSVLEFDPVHEDAADGFRTTSLHSFADHDAITLARTSTSGSNANSSGGRNRQLLTCDPQGRLCAMTFYSDFVALLPTKEHNLDDLLQIDEEVFPEANADIDEDGRKKKKARKTKQSSANKLLPGSDVISLIETCKISFVRDMCFLYGYNEPVLLFLHESTKGGPTWPGRLRDAKDTCGIKAFSINTTHKRYPVLFEKKDLPYDAFAVQGVPGVAGKCLVLCRDYILVVGQGRASYAVAVNKYALAGFASEVPLSKMPEPRGGDAMHSMNVTQARKNAFLVIPEAVPEVSKNAENQSNLGIDLSCCKLNWLQLNESSNATNAKEVSALITLKSGQLVRLRLDFDAMARMRGTSSQGVFDFRVCGSTSIPSCVATVGRNLCFVGSKLGCSVLIRCRKEGKSPGGGSTEDDAIPEDDDIKGVETDVEMTKGGGGGVEDDDELERELFSSGSKDTQSALTLTVCDRLSNLGPILDMVNINLNQDDLALAACVGYGKHSSVAILSQNLRYNKLLQVDLPNIRYLQTVYSQKPSNQDDSQSQEDVYHAFLILSTSEATMVLETKEELELVTDKLNFETNYATICAGNLMGNSRIVQIHKRGLRIMNGPSVVQDITHEEIASHLPSSEATNTNTKKMEVEIVDACVCDPFVFLLTSDKRFCLLERNEDSNQSGKPMKFSDKVRLDIASMSIIHNRCNYFESGEDDSHLAFLCDSRGDLEIVTLPNFTTVFKTKMVYQGYNILHARDSLDDAEMNLKKPQTVVTQIDCQVDRLSNELWVCMMTSDGFLYVYKLERNESNDAFYFTRKNILNEVLLKAASASAIPRKLIRIENVNSHYGYFVTGEKPLAIFFNQGQVRILSAFKDGPITSFTPFHNVNCKHGFVFATQSGDVNLCNLNDRVSTKFDWCVESMPVKGTVHKVTYSAEAKVLAAIVSSSIPYRQRKPEASGGDAHATNVYAAQEAALASSGKEEAYEVQLISPETFETLWTHLLAPGELALSISSVYIKNQTDQSVSSMLAVGTAFPRGEDYPCRGNIHFFKIEKQDIPNAEVGQPSAKWGGSLITSKDFRGAPGGGGVHVVSSLDGHLLVGIGIKVLMFKWNGEVPPATPPGYPDIPQLEQCGFFDSTLFASSLATVKKFVLSGDRMKGINFLRWLDRGNEQKVLQQLSTDYEKPPIHHVQFLIDGSTLTLMGIDMQGNIRIYAFDPADPGSFKGKKLLNRAIFYSGGRVSRMVRINPKASSESQAAVTVSRKIGVCISSFTASLAMLLPLDETTFKRLRSLQKRLITSLVQPAGLNPNAYRHGHYVDSTSGPLESSDNVLDGNVVWKFLNLTVEEQHKLAKLIGSRRETILSNLKELSIGMSVY